MLSLKTNHPTYYKLQTKHFKGLESDQKKVETGWGLSVGRNKWEWVNFYTFHQKAGSSQYHADPLSAWIKTWRSPTEFRAEHRVTTGVRNQRRNV